MVDLVNRIDRIYAIQRVGRLIPDRTNPLEFLSREEVRDRYRFYPETIIMVVGMIYGALDAPTVRNSPLPPLISLLVTLQFFASGGHFIIIGDAHGVSKSSVSRAVVRTATAIADLRNLYIKFPSGLDVRRVQREFFNIARFPKVLGVIDGTHIKILAPSINEPVYVNRKGFHSLNVQMVCDASFRVINVVAKWPGSVHDSRMFRESALCRMFEDGRNDGLLLGDSGYACKPYLLTPYLNPQNQVQERFNSSLTQTRVIIEQTFGILKRRFPCLAYGLRIKTSNVPVVVVACAVLHNLGLETGDIFPRSFDTHLDCPRNHVQPDNAGLSFQDVFAASYFS